MLRPELELEREALELLLGSEGWKYFMAYVAGQWGDTAVVQHMRSGLSEIARGDAAGEHATAAQILSTQRRVRALVEWPAKRLAELERIRHEPPAGRRRRKVQRHGIGTDVTGAARNE